MPLDTQDGLRTGGLRNPGELGAIPQEQSLTANYDAAELGLSDGALVSTWPDESGNGHDLTAGTEPTFKTGILNGNPIVEFDGSDDYLDHSSFTNTQPSSEFAVIKWLSTGHGNDTFAWNSSNGDKHGFVEKNGSWRMLGGGGNFNNMGSSDTNWHVVTCHWDGSSSVLRVDQNEFSPGNEPNDLTGFTLGAQGSGYTFADVRVGQVLVYGDDQSANFDQIETYLADNWGLTL